MKKVIIFGAGNCGRLIAKNLIDRKIAEVLYFVDNDIQKHRKSIDISTSSGGGGGIMCISPSSLTKKAFDSIIVGTFTGYYEIKEQLENMGIDKDKIDVSHIELNVRARIAFLQDFSNVAKALHLSGDTAEVGVYRGDFARFINEFFPDKKCYLFDTFEGFDIKDISKDSVMAQNLGARHFNNTSVDLVLSKMPFPTQCVIKKGYFPESAKGLKSKRFCFVNLDCDLYEPILNGLRFFYPKMVKNGVILIHEYFSQGYVGVKEAVEEFIKESKDEILKMPIGDNLSIMIIKT